MSRIFDDLPSSNLNLNLDLNSNLNSLLTNNNEKTHKLAYEWSFWQHFRPTSIPTDTMTLTSSSTLPSNVDTNTEIESIDNETNDKIIINYSDSKTHHLSTNADNNTNAGINNDKNDTVNHEIIDNGDADEEKTDNTDNTADLRAAQYVNGTTLLSFPKFNSSSNNEQTDTIDSVEQFWESLINLKNLNEVPIDTEYFFFKKGIKPLWEDEFNKNGGRWYFSFNNNNQKHRRNFMSVFWELLLIKLVSGQFLPTNFQLPLNEEILDNSEFNNLECKIKLSNKELNKLILDDIAGIVVSLRSKKIIISIWNTHLSYEKFKKDNDINGNSKDIEYNHTFREHLNPKSKHIFEEIGLTTYQFRQLIYESVSETLNEALNLVKTKETANDLNKTYKQKIFKYTPHFVDPTTENNKKGKYKSKKNSNGNTNNNGNYNKNKNNNEDSEKFSNLGKIRKKVEFNDNGLMVEELNVLSFKQKWNRKRRPVINKI